ncbi:MAG: U32 family peptidase [Lachnospiraceae bacterium]
MKPEILAPAGSMEALKAAVHAGADAVYLGGNRFGARAYAGNFDEAALLEAIEYSHLYGVKVYLTINTLFRNEEINVLYDYLAPFYEAGLDAVIVQDLGVLYYVHENFPDLPIHASTQMTITTEYAYRLLKEYGVTRIVPARELSMDEIRQLKADEEAPEVEVFVQGALCYCYSGQCLMSSMLGGRSGNRGRCAQTCRLPYTVYEEQGIPIKTKGAYLLSPKDLCGLEAVPELVKAGVDSFKIEGRMKKPEYVAVCVRAYRKILDAWYDGDFSEALVQHYQNEMAEVFNRGGFTKGYYHQKNGKDMMSIKAPGHIGVSVGTITGIRKNQIEITLQKEVYKGDIFVIEGKKKPVTLTCNVEGKQGERIILNAPRTRELFIHQTVSRMQKQPLDAELKSYAETERRIPLSGNLLLKTGEKARLSLILNAGDRQYRIEQTGDLVETAQARPLTEEVVLDKVGKMGGTRYYFDDFSLDMDTDVFYPLKALKDLRRKALEALEDKVKTENRRTLSGKCSFSCDFSGQRAENGIRVMVSDKEQLAVVSREPRITDIYVDLQYFEKKDIIELMNRYPDYGYVLPPVLRMSSRRELEDLPIKESRRIMVRCIDELAYLREIGYSGEVMTDYSLYGMNDYAAMFIRKIFPEAGITVPVELNHRQILSLAYPEHNSEIEVYGYQQLMISAQCMQETTKGCNRKNASFIMKDRMDKTFLVKSVCKYCYNLVYNGLPTVLFDCLDDRISQQTAVRLHFTRENAVEVQQVLDAFFEGNTLSGEKTRGHYNRGVE